MSTWVAVAETKDLVDGEGMAVEVQGQEIGIFCVSGTYFAVSNTCTHVGAPLTEGYVEGDHVMCPWHGAKFCLKTGASQGPPAMGDLNVFAVRSNNDRLELLLESE